MIHKKQFKKRFSFSLIFIFILLILTSCFGKISEQEIATIKDSIPDIMFLGDQISLPNQYISRLSYTFDQEDFFDQNGYVIKEDFFDHIVNITVMDDRRILFTKEITISRNVEALFDEAERYIKSFVRTRTNNNLNLVTEYYGYPEVSISYQSTRPDIIGHDGTHYEHEYDEKVFIHVEVLYRGMVHLFTIEVEAVGVVDRIKLERVQAWLDDYMANVQFTSDLVLPTSHPNYGGVIKWIASDPLVIVDSKYLFLPKEAKKVLFMTQITYPGGDTNAEYLVDVEKCPNYDEDERAKQYLEILISDSFSEFLVLYDGTSPSIVQNLIEGPEVKNKLFGYGREDIYNVDMEELFYEGYDYPNLDGVFFIVVHETGIRIPGRNAKFFSDFQYSKAYNEPNQDDALTSWHYTVDDHSIYQSFLDENECWHAGDGSIYGIGIEMCLNPEGNYNASMLNNARLIASLLIKHNLGMKSMKMHHDYANKACPETMIKDRRWFEFLNLISKEYVSQVVLSKYDIKFTYNDIEQVVAWPIDNFLYKKSSVNNQSLELEVSINGVKFNKSVTLTK